MFFDRYQGGQNLLIIHIAGYKLVNSRREEFIRLCEATGGKLLEVVDVHLREANSASFISQTQVESIGLLVDELQPDVVIFNHQLSPSQERNLEKHWKTLVIDRDRLILDIFASRAVSHVGKLQVELAQLEYISTRLVRGWTHLERQKGGIGMRGPGEKQLEMDKRILHQHIESIKKKLKKCENVRQLNSKQARKNKLPRVALMGYTNSGKSSLHRKLTHSAVQQKDMLFTTLDSTFRTLKPNHASHSKPIICVDTVGFVENLNHGFFQAFRSTLDEVLDADLLLHVVDIASPTLEEEMQTFHQVLGELDRQSIPIIKIYNKIDLLPQAPLHSHLVGQEGNYEAIWLSALDETNLEVLKEAIHRFFWGSCLRRQVVLAPHQAKLRHILYELSEGQVAESFDEEGNILMDMQIREAFFQEAMS